MDSKEKHSGTDKEVALNELRDFLNFELAAYQPVDMFQQQLDALEDDEQRAAYQSVYRRLFWTITLDEGVFDKNPTTATPGDPWLVEMHDGTPYVDAALEFMLGKLDSVARLVGINTEGRGNEGLTPEDYGAIHYEIIHQHEIQIVKNHTSFQRLKEMFKANPPSINEWRSVIALMARSVDADIVMHAMLLNWYPEIDSIEDLKRTCLFDRTSYLETRSQYKDNLRALGTRSWGRFNATIIPDKDLVPRPRKLGEHISDNVRSTKTVIAEIADSDNKGLVFEVVEKLNEYAFPVGRELHGVEAHIVDGENVQPVYVQYYLRVKRNRGDDSEDEQIVSEMEYNANALYIVKDGIRRTIHDMKK